MTGGRVSVIAADLPAGVQYNRIEKQSGQPGQGAPSAMLSDPAICSDGLTKAIGT